LLRCSGAGSRFDCTVIAPASGPLVEDLEASGIAVHVSQDASVLDIDSYEGRITELCLLLAKQGANVVLVNSALSFHGADVAQRLGIPVVWAIHESFEPLEFLSTAYPPGTVHPEVRAAFQRALRGTNALVFEAEATRRLYEASASPDRTVVVPYGVNLASIDRYMAHTSRSQARRAVGLPEDARVLLVMGTFEPRKSQTVVVEAFARVAEDHEKAWLVLVGDTDTSYAQGVKDFVAQRGFADRTLIVPVVSDVYLWYRCADVLVSASDVESLPRSVLEAMGFGLAVVAASVFGLPEVLTDGETGYLFAARDLEAATSALRRVLDADSTSIQSVADAGQRVARAHHDSSHYSSDLVTLLAGLRENPGALPGALLAERTAE
jgi:D-inositol-3-phosphate glycosyltransferase